MNYYRIRHTLSPKVLGNYPQVKEIVHNCHVDSEPKFIQHFRLKEIDFEPVVSNPILYSKSKKTDLIEHLGIGFSHRLLMSKRLKYILESFKATGVQFFKCSIFHKDTEDKNYWIMNAFNTNQEVIDFKNSEISVKVRKIEGGTKLESLNISSQSHFDEMSEFYKKSNSFLKISKVALRKNINMNFFILRGIEGGLGYYVSEKMKNEIEESECSGIEFQPIHLTFNEWISKNGEREKVYGKV